MPVTCTPKALLASYPCLAYLSESELKAVMVVAYADNLGLTVDQVLENSACFMCLSDKQHLQSAASIIGDAFLRDLTVDEIRERIKCLLCAKPGQIKAALTYELCQYFEAQV